MSRYSHPYQQHCSDGCGCCEPLDLEQSGSISLPEDLTPEQRLLWAIFGKQPPEEYNDETEEDDGESDLRLTRD